MVSGQVDEVDDLLTDMAVDRFRLGYDPNLLAGDLGMTLEQVYDSLRAALTVCHIQHSRPTAGRKRKFASDQERWDHNNEKRKKPKQKKP